MRLRGALRNRQPQAAAWCAHAGDAVKPVKHALAVLSRNARPGVSHNQQRSARLLPHLDIDAPAARGVLQRVVDQVAGERAQPGKVSRHHYFVGVQHARIHPEREGARGTLAHRLARQRIEPQRHPLTAARGLFLPRQIQQLCDQMAGAVNAAVQGMQRGAALGIIRRALGQLGLQFERRERRAQFMRGISHKRALGIKRLPKPFEQTVERRHQ